MWGLVEGPFPALVSSVLSKHCALYIISVSSIPHWLCLGFQITNCDHYYNLVPSSRNIQPSPGLDFPRWPGAPVPSLLIPCTVYSVQVYSVHCLAAHRITQSDSDCSSVRMSPLPWLWWVHTSLSNIRPDMCIISFNFLVTQFSS